VAVIKCIASSISFSSTDFYTEICYGLDYSFVLHEICAEEDESIIISFYNIRV